MYLFITDVYAQFGTPTNEPIFESDMIGFSVAFIVLILAIALRKRILGGLMTLVKKLRRK